MNKNKFLSTLIYRSIFIIFALLVFACNKSDDDNSVVDGDGTENTDGSDGADVTDNPDNTVNTLPTIVELAQSVEGLSILIDALGEADAEVLELLSTEGSNTVFAPTNDAFVALLAQLDGFDSLDDFDEESEKTLLTEILKYHVVSGTAAFSTELTNGAVLETVQTEELVVEIDASIFIQDKTEEKAEVVGADNEASNGVVHLIDKILLPQAVLDQLFPKPSIIELVAETEEISLLEEAIATAGLVDALSADGPFTVFAPTNAAAEGLFEALGDGFNSFEDFDNFIEIEILKQILLYHVVDGNLTSSDLIPGDVQTLLTSDTIEIISSGDTFVIGDASDVDANILSADNEASNGVVHIIDKILIPTEVQEFLDSLNEVQGKTISELVQETEGFSFLRDALELTGLLDTLNGEGPFTVFAPTDDALVGLLALFGSAYNSIDDFDTDVEIDVLRQVLLYHVLPGNIGSVDLAAGTVGTLSASNTLDVVNTSGGFGLVDVTGITTNIILTDIPAKNGVIHAIDRVLLPQSAVETLASEVGGSLLSLLSSLDDTEFVQFLIMGFSDEFEELLNQEFTFFLPTNSAFLELFASLDGYDSLADFNTAEDLEILSTILSYHFVANSKLTSDQISDGDNAYTLQGELLELALDAGVAIIDKTNVSANVTKADIAVLGGVVHLIDKVLLPQEILDAL